MTATEDNAAALRVLIADDEPLAVERLQLLCARIGGVQLAGTAGDGAQALRLIEALRPDTVLLDISMPDMDGMALARALAGADLRPGIIFVTAHENFAVAAFELAAVDYLLKPVSEARLAQALARARAAHATRRGTAAQGQGEPNSSAPNNAAQATRAFTQEFWVPLRGEIVRLAACEVELIEAERDYMRLHAGSRSYLIHQTISALEEQLDPARFLRIHRSVMVALNAIEGMRHDGAGNWEVLLRGRGGFRVGRSYLNRVRDLAGR